VDGVNLRGGDDLALVQCGVIADQVQAVAHQLQPLDAQLIPLTEQVDPVAIEAGARQLRRYTHYGE